MSVSELAGEGISSHLDTPPNPKSFNSPHPVRAIALRTFPQGEAIHCKVLSC